MANNILMVSIINDKVHLLELKRTIKSYQVLGEPIIDADRETLDDYGARASEIIINADLPSCNHYWGAFPKVSNRYLKDIVIRETRQNFLYSGIIRSAIQDVGSTYEEGTPKRLLSCILVDDNEVSYIENNLFGKFTPKISHINPTAVALCSVIASNENPRGDFMVIAVGENSTNMAISSPKGDVKVARHLTHLGFRKDSDLKNAELCKTFFNEIEKEINKTSLHYLQTFQDSECSNFFMLGNPSVKLALEKYGTYQNMPSIRFGFTHSPLSSLDGAKAAEWAYIFGSLYCHRNYNLLSRQVVINRNFNLAYRYAMIIIGAAILGALLYLYQVDPVSADKIAEYRSKNNELVLIQNEVADLKNQVSTLNQFRGWENFYENTYKNQPAWGKVFSEGARNKPEEILIENLRIDPVTERGGLRWNAVISGHIRVSEWAKGLELLRKYGAVLHRSPNFEIEKIKYAPASEKENRPGEEIGFKFQIDALLTPQDRK